MPITHKVASTSQRRLIYMHILHNSKKIISHTPVRKDRKLIIQRWEPVIGSTQNKFKTIIVHPLNFG